MASTSVPAVFAAVSPTCPSCHTVAAAVISGSPEASTGWRCARCDSSWTAKRLDTAATYERYAAARV